MPMVLQQLGENDPRFVPWVERALMRSLARRGWTMRDLAYAFGRFESTIVRHCRGLRMEIVRSSEAWASDPRERRRRWAKTFRDTMRAQKLCITCGQPSGDASRCPTCIAKRKATR